MADDLERAAKVTQLRRREGWAQVLGAVLLLLPLLVPAINWLLQAGSDQRWPLGGVLMRAALVALALAAICGGFTFGRGLVQRWRLGWRPGSADVVLRFVTPVALLPSLLLLVLLGVVVGCDVWDGAGVGRAAGTAVLAMAEVIGFWMLGVWAAAMVTFAGLLLGSVRSEIG